MGKFAAKPTLDSKRTGLDWEGRMYTCCPLYACRLPHSQHHTSWVWTQIGRSLMERMEYHQAASAFESAHQVGNTGHLDGGKEERRMLPITRPLATIHTCVTDCLHAMYENQQLHATLCTTNPCRSSCSLLRCSNCLGCSVAHNTQRRVVQRAVAAWTAHTHSDAM